jgi:hypothetical protein
MKIYIYGDKWIKLVTSGLSNVFNGDGRGEDLGTSSQCSPPGLEDWKSDKLTICRSL